MHFPNAILMVASASLAAGLVTSNGPLTAKDDAAKLKECVVDLRNNPKWTGSTGYSCGGKTFYLKGNGRWESKQDCIGGRCGEFLYNAAGEGAEWGKCEQKSGLATCETGWKKT